MIDHWFFIQVSLLMIDFVQYCLHLRLQKRIMVFELMKGVLFMSMTANLNVQIEPDIKEKAEKILSALGIPASNAINMFYKQIILQRGLPFDLKLPAESVLNFNQLSEREIESELQKGLDDVKNGNIKSANQTFADIRKEYNL